MEEAVAGCGWSSWTRRPRWAVLLRFRCALVEALPSCRVLAVGTRRR